MLPHQPLPVLVSSMSVKSVSINPTWPMWRSAFVPVVLLRFLKRFTSGRVTISETSDTARNTTDWIVMLLVNIVVMAAQTEPRTNHIDTSCVVKPSQSNMNIAKPIHTIGIYCPIGLSLAYDWLYLLTRLVVKFSALPMFYICVILLLHNNCLRSTSQNYHLMRQLF